MDSNNSDLYGWQLNNPDQETFDVEIMEVFGECRDCDPAAFGCAMPCEAVRRLVPKKGKIVSLGHEKEDGKTRMSYFALMDREDVKFILLRSPDYLWATASYISHEQVPPWAMSQLSRHEDGRWLPRA
jgi:hypothetical protein